MPPCVEVKISAATPLSASVKFAMSSRTSEVSPAAVTRSRNVPLSTVRLLNDAPTPEITGVVSSRSTFASVMYTSSAPAEDRLATLSLVSPGIRLVLRVVDAQRAERADLAVRHVRVDGVFDQLLARERAQHAARAGALAP